MRALLVVAHILGLLGQETCEPDTTAALQTRAADELAYNNSEGRSDNCYDINIPVYTSVPGLQGGSFAVKQDNKGYTQCGLREGNWRSSNRGGFSELYCQCHHQNGKAWWGTILDDETGLPNWDFVLPDNPKASAARCFRAGTSVDDPPIVTPSGYNFSCAEPSGKTERAPHRSCRFTHRINFPAGHQQEVPPNTQVVGLCYMPVTNPGGALGVQTDNAKCQLLATPVPSVCSSRIRTGPR